MIFCHRRLILLLCIGWVGCCLGCRKTETPVAIENPATPTIHSVSGVIKKIKSADHQIVISHDAIPNYMIAMTMPFALRETNQLTGLRVGDRVKFLLLVTKDESWIEQLVKTGQDETSSPPRPPTPAVGASDQVPLLDYKFTNELGQLVSFNDFKGQAVGLTFFFTRCPLPEYCPRLMKNFAGATEKLRTAPNAPTNWHFLAITFDPAIDTPTVLREYGQRYNYDPNHWSFLTGASNRIAELAEAAGAYYEPDATGAFFNHNFRTLVLDAAGQLQMSFPIGGDLSTLLAEEILKAAASTNH